MHKLIVVVATLLFIAVFAVVPGPRPPARFRAQGVAYPRWLGLIMRIFWGTTRMSSVI